MTSRSALLLILLACTRLPAFVIGPSTGLPQLDLTGAAALRQGDYARALTEMAADSTVDDSAFYYLKLGLAHQGAGNPDKAISYFGQAAKACSLLAPFAYESIARTALGQNRPADALAAYRAALGCTLPPRYQSELQSEVTTLVVQNRLNVADLGWVSAWYHPATLGADTVQRELVTAIVARHDWAILDSMLKASLATGEDTKTPCMMLGLLPLDSIPDSVLTTEVLFDAAWALQTGARYQAAADWLARAAARSDFRTKIPRKRSLYLQSMLAFHLAHQEEAAKGLRRYVKEFGPTPAIVMTIARAYRALGQKSKATDWYNRHIQLYPQHPQTQEILWFRAWEQEDNGQYERAIALYRKLRLQYHNGPRTPEAWFREGLLHFRLSQYDSACQSWQSLISAYPQTSEATAAAYWRAKALESKGKHQESIAALAAVIASDPLSYYSYRAQDALREFGDSTDHWRVSPVVDIESSRRWLDSIASPPQALVLSHADSAWFRLGIMLAAAGLPQRAEHCLDPLLQRYPSSLTLQFEVAAVYALCGYSTQSFRTVRSLLWRIPQELRPAMPLPIVSMLYPKAFATQIEQPAGKYTVEPNLVCAIARQESMFDPQIVSPVGAVGLMQLMPYTGANIAKGLGESFTADSLYVPSVNIRYGTYYVRQLFEQFNGNVVLVLAAYNAGPNNASRWYEQNKSLGYDLFVENISFTETRGYVKRVLANYWTYNRLGRLDSYANVLTWNAE